MKRKISEIIRGFTLYVPLGWILTCFDQGANWFYRRPFKGAFTLLGITFLVGVLYRVGRIAAYGHAVGTVDGEPLALWEQVRNLVVLLSVLVFFTLAFS